MILFVPEERGTSSVDRAQSLVPPKTSASSIPNVLHTMIQSERPPLSASVKANRRHSLLPVPSGLRRTPYASSDLASQAATPVKFTPGQPSPGRDRTTSTPVASLGTRPFKRFSSGSRIPIAASYGSGGCFLFPVSLV